MTAAATASSAAHHALIALALFLGCAQLLLMVQKANVLRVMGCTAEAVIVAALALAGALTPGTGMGRRFFQAAVLPFVLLFMEASSSSSSSLGPSLAMN